MGPSEIGLDADRLAICGNRLLELVLPKQRVAEIGISLRVCPKTSSGITKFSQHEAD